MTRYSEPIEEAEQHIIILEHIWTKEQKNFIIDTISKETVSFKWGMNGVYDLNIKDNTLRARSAKARRKGPALWQAVNIKELREKCFAKFNPKNEEHIKAISNHMNNMPHARAKTLSKSPKVPF